MIRRVLLSLFFTARLSTWAAETPLTGTADLTEFGTTAAVYRGHALLRGENLLLSADEVRAEHDSGKIIASGHVAFTRDGARLLAERLVYYRRDGRFEAANIRLGRPPYFAEAASADGTPSEITLHQARLTYGEPGPWEPTLIADTIVISRDGSIRTEKAAAGIGHAQPFRLPRFQHESARPFPASVELLGGFRRSLGAFAQAQVLVPVTPDVRLGGDLGVFTRRGVMVGPAGRYASPNDPERTQGAFRSGYINDRGDTKTDILARPIDEDRGYAAWQHQQRLGDRLTLNAQLNWWKDSDVLRDFKPRVFFPVQEPDTFVESVYTGANFFLSAFTRLQPNSFHQVQERLPEIRFDALPNLIGADFYQRFNGSFAVLREDPPLGGPTLRSDRLDAYYALSRAIAPRDWLTFTPLVGGRLTHYLNSSVGRVHAGNYLRLLGELGLDAALRSSGTFDYQNPRWKIDGLRHLLTPRLCYRYIPEADKGRAQIPRIDRETFATYLPPLGLGDVRHIDDLHATNTLRLGLDNTVQTRDPVLGSRDLLVLNLTNDFRFKRRPGERDVSEIHAEVAAMPARWLQFDLYQSFAPQSLTLRELNSGLTVHDGTAWMLRFGNNFLRGQIQDYSLHSRVRLNERFEAVARLHYDARQRRFNEQTYGVAHTLGNLWLVSYSVSVYSGRKRESNFGFDLRIDALRF